MFNRIEAYSEAGTKAAVAINQHDAARAEHWRRYFRDMMLCESVDGDDRKLARQAFDSAYTAARNVTMAH